MITYKPIIIPGGRRKDGTWPVKIRVTFRGVSRRLPTTLVCTDQDLTRSGKIKNANILQKAGELIARMRATTEDLSPFTLEAWDVDQVVDHIRGALSAEQFRLDFFAFADEYLDCKLAQTRRSYDMALNTLERFLGGRSLDVNAITRKMLLDFVAFVDAEPRMRRTKEGVVPSKKPKKVPGGASAGYLMKLAHIFNAARFRYNDEDTGRILIPRSPFDGMRKAYPPGQGAKPLPREVVQALIDCDPVDGLERISRAAFLVSFCIMGANLADLWDKHQEPGEVIVYNRRKTARRRADHAEVRVLLPACIEPFLADLGYLSGSAGWWLPELHRWKDGNTATTMVNKGLTRIAERLGVERFTFGAARKTWATQARKLGVEKATVDEALAHIGDFRVTDIYAERNWELAWAANEKVLGSYTWKSAE